MVPTDPLHPMVIRPSGAAYIQQNRWHRRRSMSENRGQVQPPQKAIRPFGSYERPSYIPLTFDNFQGCRETGDRGAERRAEGRIEMENAANSDRIARRFSLVAFSQITIKWSDRFLLAAHWMQVKRTNQVKATKPTTRVKKETEQTTTQIPLKTVNGSPIV